MDFDLKVKKLEN